MTCQSWNLPNNPRSVHSLKSQTTVRFLHFCLNAIVTQNNVKSDSETLFYSIVMTTCSTVLAMGAMPLLLYLYSQGFSGLGNAVPYTGIFIALMMTIIPCAVGIAINHWAPRYSQIIIKVNCTSGAKVCNLWVFEWGRIL